VSEPRTILITGASDGIGAAAARRLVGAGHHVVLVGRSPRKTAALAADLAAPFHVADFAELAQVRALAEAVRADHPRIDVLANNAGGMWGPRTLTADGFEMTFQVNQLAPFLLTNLLMPTLVERSATVVQTASRVARMAGPLDLDDLQLARGYSPSRAYGSSKLANILFTRELHRRYHDRGIAAVAFHPGAVATNFGADAGGAIHAVYHTPLRRVVLAGADRGGAALAWLATGEPGTTWQPGGYYERNRLARTNRQADDTELARGLWDRCAAMVQIPA
jgi:NAD(P)-dependent dehydrogenase (short-subunit alcohol dehydrogenase family)